ncbi:hypothetical protein ACIHCM_02365 [Streptomyces sp. NPDC052023]|uniref:hypothetical protein n=1 Tax=Streptomyces sp. NPDC052023 TaxID=3365681 RepID=UPI0037D2E0BD
MQNSALRKKWSARIAAATVIAATAALVPAAGAQAGTPHQFRLCNNGRGYDTVVEFPSHGGYAFRVLAGKCQTVGAPVPSSNQAVTLHAVQGAWKGSRSYVFAGFSYDDRRGIDITTSGTYGAVNWSWR